MDDIPIGGGNNNQFSAANELPPESGASAKNADADLPLEGRLVSKTWSVRKEAFETLKDQFKKAPYRCSNDLFRDSAHNFSKFLEESNPGALASALDCYQAFADHCEPSLLAQNQASYLKPLIDKGLGAAKPDLKAKSLECVLITFEVSEAFDEDTLDAIEKFCKSDKLKILTTAISLLANLIAAFGIKRFKLAQFQEHIEKTANSSNPGARNEAMNCYKSLYLHMGEATESIMTNLKKAQQDQLKKDFEEIKKQPKGQRKRLTRSEKEAAKDAELDAAIAEQEQEEEKIDVFDMAAPVDILKTFNEAWIEEYSKMTKWNEKCDKLKELQTQADVPKLAMGSYVDLFTVLKKDSAGSNVNVSQQAIKAIGILAKGLRTAFATNAKEIVPVLFPKFKERRLVDEIMLALTNCMMCIPLSEIIEYVPMIAKEKAPATKINICKFLESAVQTTYIDDLQDIAPDLLPQVMKVCEEKDADCRATGLHLVGILLARLGDEAMAKFIDGMIPQKKTKVDEAKATYKPSKFDKSKKKEEAAAKKKALEEKKKAAEAAKKPAAKKAAPMNFDDDEDPMEESKAPAKKPALGKRPVKKAAAGEEKKDGPPGKPALSSAKPSGGTSGPVKAMTADMLTEDDIGGVISKENAIEIATEFYDAEHIANLDDAKAWKDKVEGLKGLQAQIEELKPDPRTCEATCRFVKAKCKEWKESNINLMKEAVNTLKAMCDHCDDVTKKCFHIYSPFLSEKIGDIKMAGLIKPLIVQVAEFATAKYVAGQLMKNGLATKAPNNIKESCNVLATLIDEFGAASTNVKNVIDYAMHCANNPNKAIRDAALGLLAILYKHMGETIRNFLTNIKEATMKLIDAEFEKVTPLQKGEFQSTREVKGEAAVEAASAPAASLDDCLPRTDITKMLNAKLIKEFDPAGKDWKVKAKAAEKVEVILKEAGMRIKPDGIGPLMECMKQGMKESNMAIIKPYLKLMGSLAEATGEPIHKYTKKCLVPMLTHLSNKQPLIRGQVVAPMTLWAEAVGDHKVMDQLFGLLKDANPEFRSEVFTWVLARKPALAKVDHKETIKPLIACLTDRDAKIRNASEEVVIEVMGFIGFNAFQQNTQDLKPAVKQTVIAVLQKAKNMCAASGAGGGDADEEMEEQKTSSAAKTVSKPTKQASSRAVASDGPTLKKKEGASPNKLDQSLGGRPRTAVIHAKPGLKAKPKQEEEEEFLVNPGNKEKRAQVDARSKWMHEELKPDQVDRVKVACEQIFGLEVCKSMFGNDFKKHQVITKKIVGMIETQPDVLKEILDVFFKWCLIKMTESSNTTLYVAVFDCLHTIFDFLLAEEYYLWDHEAYIVIPMLCEKSGVNNAILKSKVKALIKMCFQLYDPKKSLGLIIKFGAGNKSLKNVAESLDEIAIFMKQNGVDQLNEKDLKFIAKLADSGDKGVREGALQVLSEAYKVLDEDIWRVIGGVTVKVQGLLDQRFKKVKGLGSSHSTANMGRSTIGSKHGESQLARSFVPGQSSNSTTPRNGLMFQKGMQKQASQPGFQQQSNLGRSFNNRLQAPTSANKFNSSLSNNSQGGGRNSRSPAKNRFGSNHRSPLYNQENQHRVQESSMRSGQSPSFRQQPQFQPNEQIIADDDEDLRQHLNQLQKVDQFAQQEKPKEKLAPETQRQVDSIMKHVLILKYSELAKRVESLIVINEIIQTVSKHQEGIKHTANELINAFTHVLIDIFERPMSDFPLRFAKYFVTIVNKACSCKEIMREVDEKEIYDLAEQLLTRLLIENLDKVGDNKEGEFILKNLNASMLRLLENCNHTHIFCVLFNLLRKYKDYKTLQKLPGLIIKCLLKLSKILEKLISRLDTERILFVVHEYLISIDHDSKTSNDEMGIRIVKTIVNELVKVHQRSIGDAYKIIEQHEAKDRHIHRWIKIILNCQEKEQAGTAPAVNGEAEIDRVENMDPHERQQEIDDELSAIFGELRNTDQFEAAIPKLNNFLLAHPEIDLKARMSSLSAHFQNFIMTHLHAYRKSLAETGSTPQHTRVKVDNWTGAAADNQSSGSASKSKNNSFVGGASTANRFGGSHISSSGMEADDQAQAIGRHRSPGRSEIQPQDTPSQKSGFGTNSFKSRLSNSNLSSTNRFKPSTSDVNQPTNRFSSSGLNSSASKTFMGQSSNQTQPSSGLRFPNTSRNTVAGTSNMGGGTGGIQKNTTDQSGSATDRINQYQNKLSSMREKFQQHKAQTSSNTNTNQFQSRLQPATTKHSSAAVGSSGQKQNFNSSFSAMNNSLSKKWNEFKSQSKVESAQPKDMSSTMGPAGQASSNMLAGRQTQVLNPSNSAVGTINMGGSMGAGSVGGASAGASNQDLKSRLDAMKAKLRALKKD